MFERSTASAPDAPDTPDGTLPRWLARYADWGLYGLLAGTILCLAAFVTNPVPDPSFPWATLPASVRFPVAQPRIEHWPVTYTAGIWLWVFCLPAVFLAGYRRYAGRYAAESGRSATLWLVGLPTAAMFALTTYCRFFWPKLYPASWNAPSYTFVCWLYCSSYVPLWSNAAYAVAVLGLVATLLAYRGVDLTKYALAAFGVLALPLGLPALYAASLRHSDSDPSEGR
ncbi:hypothetical protein M0R89_12215 [Halorussus limi]|uniref:Uncharacterized protein n=1 Tax=Halorussus limi TaxID=2938695 RepID=A0A8U0HQZ7_9EURY|nr:hypothetical protein [Halorussus limi]UPV73308.1 hypothetical protein M0R89_12215 [Halorussus limi]